VAVVAVIALVAVGCGDDSDDTSDGSTTTGVATQVVDLFFTPGSGGPNCTDTSMVERTVEGPDVLAATLTELLAGPTADETAGGLTSWFSADTADALKSVEIVDGTAHIDFTDFRTQISGASSSCGSSQLMSQLDQTAKQFPAVERTLYSVDGDVEAFYEWLQRSPPDYYTTTTVP
jgi:spore germination protein GerM